MKKQFNYVIFALALGFTPMHLSIAQSELPHEELSDGQIAHVLKVLNDGEVNLASYAEPYLNCEEVRCHAEHLIHNHSLMNQEILTWAEAKSISPDPSSASGFVEHSAHELLSRLHHATKDETFDWVFVDASIESHVLALHIVNQLLLPQVDDEGLNALLIKAREDIVRHLEEARLLREHLLTDGLHETMTVTFDDLAQ